MNKNILSNAIMLVVGAGVGSFVTYKILKRKYEQRVKEDIASVVESFSNNETSDTIEVSDDAYGEDDSEEDNEKTEYAGILRSEGYINEEEEEDDEMIEPYVIVPAEFDENGYKTVTLYYYHEDDIVETLIGQDVLDDETIEKWIGKDSLTHFGEFEDDSVFVRNDNMKTDFEILKVNEHYSEED